jgi:hypothetical protein
MPDIFFGSPQASLEVARLYTTAGEQVCFLVYDQAWPHDLPSPNGEGITCRHMPGTDREALAQTCRSIDLNDYDAVILVCKPMSRKEESQ